MCDNHMEMSSKSRKRCPACGSSNPIDAWECEMCGVSFSDAKPPKSLQQADAQHKASAAAPTPQPKSAPPKSTPVSTTQTSAAKPQTKSANGKSTTKPATTSAAATTKTATDTINAPIKNAGSIKKPKPLYASKPRFGLGSLVALVFVAAFGIAAIVFGMNTLNSGNNTPAAPAQPAAFTLDVTFTAVPTEGNAAQSATTPTALPTVAPTDAPIEVPAVVPTVEPTMMPAPAATTEPTLAPPATNSGKPSATPRPTQTPAATSAPLGTGETVTYTVKGGDTCGAVAKRLGVTVAQIIQQNKLDERCFLNVGKVLTITK